MKKKGYWATHKYSRHSVDRDVEDFVGWEKLTKMFNAIRRPVIRDIAIATFKVAGRITEGLGLRKKMFTITEKEIKISNFYILKRWKSVDVKIICLKCKTINGRYEKECSNCGANLIYGGKKKHITEPIKVKRQPFYMNINEQFSADLIRMVENAKDLLFPSPYTKVKPYSRQWVYLNMRDLGHIVGLDSLYPHWLRAQRLSQLGGERKFDELELKLFSGIVKGETLIKYVKKTRSYREKLGLTNV